MTRIGSRLVCVTVTVVASGLSGTAPVTDVVSGFSRTGIPAYSRTDSPVRFHHFHVSVPDPAAAMNEAAVKLGGTRRELSLERIGSREVAGRG
jgi:hypothetical protein